MSMAQMIKPLSVALRGKGPATMLKRMVTLQKRYGLTPAKMDYVIKQLGNMIQEYGVKATLPITAAALARNGNIIKKYQAQGIEFAVHGYRHIDHSQLSLPAQLNHLNEAGQIFRAQGIEFAGFRCPYLRWNEDTLTALSQANFVYDSSNSLFWNVANTHTTESYERALEFYGAQAAETYPALPYVDLTNNIVRIPYSLPDDEALIERLNWSSPSEMEQIWPEMFHHFHQRGELFTLGLHPERTQLCAKALIATLQEVASARAAVWCATLGQITAWWKARYTVQVESTPDNNGYLHLTMNGPAGTTLLLRSLQVKTATEPWFDGYQRALEMPVWVSQPQKRPFIGVSPHTSARLTSFLKQQGYIIETSSDPSLYSFYFDRNSFSTDEERSLLNQIERADFPLVRLARWPNGARSAFCVTGDIDALTLWDYGLRFLGN